MKRQRAFLSTTQGGVKKPKLLASSVGVSAVIPRPLGLSQVQKAQVNRLIRANEEVKFLDTAFTAVGVDITGTSNIMTATAQGTAQGQRLAAQIKPLSVRFNYTWTAPDTTNFCRVIIWQYKAASSTLAPVIPFILQSTGAGVPEPVSQYNYSNKTLYKILYDETVALSATGPDSVSISKRINLPKKLQVDFNAGAASTAAMNHVCVSVITDSAAPTHPVLNGVFRVFYTDA